MFFKNVLHVYRHNQISKSGSRCFFNYNTWAVATAKMSDLCNQYFLDALASLKTMLDIE